MPANPSTPSQRGRWLAAVVAALAVLLGALSPAAPAAAAAATGTITGRVTAAGSPVTGVEVSVEVRTTNASGQVVWTEAQSTRARTGADGTYAATVPPGTAYKVGFVSAGFAPEYYDGESTREAADPVSVSAGATTSGIDAALDRTGGLAGRVTTLGGAPIEGVVATLYRFVAKADGTRQWTSVTTDETGADGTWSIAGTAPGTYRLGFLSSGYAPVFHPSAAAVEEARDITVAAGPTAGGYDARLALPGKVTGRLVMADGTPYGGAGSVRFLREVKARDPETGTTSTSWTEAATTALAADGTFSRALPAGTYRARVDLPQLGSGFMPGLVGLDKAQDLTVAAESVLALPAWRLATSPLTGTVRTLDGAPVAGYGVEAFYRLVTDVRDGSPVTTLLSAAGAATTTDNAGGYRLVLPNRTYRLRAAGTVGGEAFSQYWPSAADHAAGTDVVLDGARSGVDFAVGRRSVANTAAPWISGAAQAGSTMTANPGTWTPSDATFTYQWLADGQPINGATGRTYTPEQLSAGGTKYAVRVTAARSGLWSTTVTSLATGASVSALGTPAFENRALPTTSGTAAVGRTLTASTGQWSTTPTGYAYQWLAGGVPVAGATAATFVPTAAELGKTVTVRVTATSGSSTATATSAPSDAVAKGTLTNTVAPTITGTPRHGQQLTAEPGTWSVTGLTFTYQWLVDGVAFPGATAATFTPGSSEVGRRVAVRVTASRAGYDDALADSAVSAPVAAKESVGVTGGPTVTGSPRVGATLTAMPGTVTPSSSGVAFQWLRDGAAIAGATGRTYTAGTDDVGRRVGVRVTYTHPERTTAEHVAVLSEVVRSTPVLRVTSTSSRRQVVLRLSVTAPGVAAPTGAVSVTERGRQLAAGTLTSTSDGALRLVVRGLAAGRHVLTVRYAGDALTAAGATTARVQVPRR